MGLDIYEQYPAAKSVFEECDEAVGGSLKKLMFKGPLDALTSTENAQPAILCHSIALLRVLEVVIISLERIWESSMYIIRMLALCFLGSPRRSLHSSALVATLSLSLTDAIKLVRLRGEAMRDAVDSQETSMKALIIKGDRLEDIEQLMEKVHRSLPEGEVAEIANINSRSQIVLSGTVKGVEYASSIIQTKGFAGRSVDLPVSAPFHCKLMEPAAEKLLPALEQTKFHHPIIDVISNVTAKPMDPPADIRRFMYEQVTKTVQWQRSIRYAKEGGVNEWVVVGPSRVLSNLLRKEYPLDAIRPIATPDDIAELGPQLKGGSS
ncbi:hypothetical protein HDV00_000367 [Rhizophlyctis rosea]|nr:hypothetical protein HDV00_000367 [Rhizophlyctis rosea]